MFEKFSVIDLIKTRSASVCTFAGNIVKFNVQTAQELRFPEYIQFLIEPKSKQFAIRACKEDAPNAVRFSKPEGEQKAQIKISNATVVDMVRKLMDWIIGMSPVFTLPMSRASCMRWNRHTHPGRKVAGRLVVSVKPQQLSPKVP